MSERILQRDEPLVAAPFAEHDWNGLSVIWPDRGPPLALDVAARSMLECFRTPTTVDELTADLVAIVGVEPSEARSVAATFAVTLSLSGLLVGPGDNARPAATSYPLAASP